MTRVKFLICKHFRDVSCYPYFHVRARLSSPAPREHGTRMLRRFCHYHRLTEATSSVVPKRESHPSAQHFFLMLMSVIINLSAERAGGRPWELVIESAKQVPRSSGALSSHTSPRKNSRRQRGLNGAPSGHLQPKMPFLWKLLLETCLLFLWFWQVSKLL